MAIDHATYEHTQRVHPNATLVAPQRDLICKSLGASCTDILCAAMALAIL